MSSTRRRHPAFAAIAAVAVLTLTATACNSDEDQGQQSPDQKKSEQSRTDDSDGTKDGKERLTLPEGLPDSIKNLDQWRDGGWKDWSKKVREARDFINPIIKDHWKPERMNKAEDNRKSTPRDVETSSATTDTEPPRKEAKAVSTPYTDYAAPAGKLFMESPKGPMVCSATVVKDPRHPGKSNLVATAGHCVHEGRSGGWLRNISFAPAYNNRGLSPQQVERASLRDRAPYGMWWAEWAQTTNYWIQKGTSSGGYGAQHDFAVLKVKPENATGRSLEETVGNAIKINFSVPRMSGVSAYGYPQAPPYDGARMFQCTDRPRQLRYDPAAPAMHWIGCSMTGGSSGGGWFVKGSSGKAELVSVNSLGSRPASWMAGPQLGSTERGVFDAISKKYS